MSYSSQSTKAIFEQALLAQAAYADLDEVAFSSVVELKAQLTAQGMSEFAAQYVATNFGVRNQPNSLLSLSGYSGTLFQRRTGDEEFVFALRGTSPSDPRDLITDYLFSTISAIGRLQVTAMQEHFDSLRQTYSFAINGLAVTGHSLGGYLATALATDLNRQDYLNHTFTYSSPGCGGKLAIIASIEEPEVIARILAHLETAAADQFQAELPRGARAPPSQARLL